MTTTLVLRALVLACFSVGVLTAGYLWGELDVGQAPLVDKAEPGIVAGPVFANPTTCAKSSRCSGPEASRSSTRARGLALRRPHDGAGPGR